MTLPVPVLDDRSYDQLLAELVARIPVYTPEWTNHGPSDPGDHAARAVRAPRREPAVPVQPDPGPDPAVAAAPAAGAAVPAAERYAAWSPSTPARPPANRLRSARGRR